MSTNENLLVLLLVALGVFAVLFAGIALWRQGRRRRALALRQRFGPEYDHLVEQYGSPAKAERELENRARRVSKLKLRELSDGERNGFARSWRHAQECFVDTPGVAVRAAHDLVREVMRSRGYPVEDFEHNVADLSVDHANVVQHYRAAHQLHASNDTEALRQAMVHYHALFDELLLDTRGPAPSSRRLTPAAV